MLGTYVAWSWTNTNYQHFFSPYWSVPCPAMPVIMRHDFFQGETATGAAHAHWGLLNITKCHGSETAAPCWHSRTGEQLLLLRIAGAEAAAGPWA